MAEDRIVLGDVAWKFGLFSFVLEHFFLIGVGLGPSIKWAEVVKFFDPTISISISIYYNYIKSVNAFSIVLLV